MSLNQCMGCQAGWPLSRLFIAGGERFSHSLRYADGTMREYVGCTAADYDCEPVGGHGWWNRFTRAWWAIGGHARVDLEAAKTIACRMCEQRFDSYDTSIMQGHDICAWSKRDGTRWIIHCGYGSDFDMSEFWFIRDYPTEAIDGICDWCIRRMLRDGVIIDSGKELQP